LKFNRPILQQKPSEYDACGENPIESIINHFDADGPDWLQQVIVIESFHFLF